MKFLTVEMDNFIKERVLYEVKVNKLSPADAHDMDHVLSFTLTL